MTSLVQQLLEDAYRKAPIEIVMRDAQREDTVGAAARAVLDERIGDNVGGSHSPSDDPG